MKDQSATRVYTRDLERLVSVVSGVYCDHSVKATTGGSGDGGFELIRPGAQPIVQLRYGRGVRVDAGAFPRLMLMQTCLDGSGSAEQGSLSTPLRRGQTVPLSPSIETHLAFDGQFSQRSVRLDIDRVEALCARWLNRPGLDRPIRFSLTAFSTTLEHAWAQAAGLIADYTLNGIMLPPSAIENMDELLISLVLSQHPHNYSEDLQRPQKPPAPRLVREAERLMREGTGQLTPAKLAIELRVSLRTLEMGFRAEHQCTPNEFLRKIRIGRAREALLAPNVGTSVTEVALANGFLHLARFSAYYQSLFGELPGQTLRRSQPRRLREERMGMSVLLAT